MSGLGTMCFSVVQHYPDVEIKTASLLIRNQHHKICSHVLRIYQVGNWMKIYNPTINVQKVAASIKMKYYHPVATLYLYYVYYHTSTITLVLTLT